MRGGFRIGAGRKKGYAAKHAEEARRVLSDMVAREIGPIGAMLIQKAKKGDVMAARELFDRAFGRPTQPIETSDWKPTTIVVRAMDMSVVEPRELIALPPPEGMGMSSHNANENTHV